MRERLSRFCFNGFEPYGFTENPNIRYSSSVLAVKKLCAGYVSGAASPMPWPTRWANQFCLRVTTSGARISLLFSRELSGLSSPEISAYTSCTNILLSLPLDLNEVLKKLPRERKVFDARSLRKSLQAACVKVRLAVKTGPKDWQFRGLLIHDFRRSGVRNLIRCGVPR